MRFLITGVAGFLGSALAKKLLHERHEVRGLDDLSAGERANIPNEVDFEQGDINDMPKLWKLMNGVDAVIHMAAKVSVRDSTYYPRDYNAVNVGGTLSVLEAMRDTGVKRLVFSSSGALYGAQESQPLHEALSPNPQSPYAVSKLAAEYYIRTTGRMWGLETICLRIFNVYGPGQPLLAANPPVIPQFFKQILSGGSVVVHGDGDQSRDFVYIDDVILALERAATIEDLPSTNKEGLPSANKETLPSQHVVVNVGSGEDIKMLDLAERIGDIAKKKPAFLMNTDSSAGVTRMRADLKQLEALLGIVPQTTLHTGLRRILEEDPRFMK